MNGWWAGMKKFLRDRKEPAYPGKLVKILGGSKCYSDLHSHTVGAVWNGRKRAQPLLTSVVQAYFVIA